MLLVIDPSNDQGASEAQGPWRARIMVALGGLELGVLSGGPGSGSLLTS